jgi:hypothetical protein
VSQSTASALFLKKKKKKEISFLNKMSPGEKKQNKKFFQTREKRRKTKR